MSAMRPSAPASGRSRAGAAAPCVRRRILRQQHAATSVTLASVTPRSAAQCVDERPDTFISSCRLRRRSRRRTTSWLTPPIREELAPFPVANRVAAPGFFRKSPARSTFALRSATMASLPFPRTVAKLRSRSVRGRAGALTSRGSLVRSQRRPSPLTRRRGRARRRVPGCRRRDVPRSGAPSRPRPCPTRSTRSPWA